MIDLLIKHQLVYALSTVLVILCEFSDSLAMHFRTSAAVRVDSTERLVRNEAVRPTPVAQFVSAGIRPGALVRITVT